MEEFCAPFAEEYGLNITDTGTSITVNFTPQNGETPTGNVVTLVDKYDFLPFAFSDGAFQMIDTVLE